MQIDRYTLIDAGSDALLDDFAGDVAYGLSASPKTLLCRYLYDETGSSIFEEICELPEYYVTRTEARILADHADEIAQSVVEQITLVELGSGSATKTRVIIEAFLRRKPALCFVPVDISLSILDKSSKSLLEQYRGLEIVAVVGPFHEGLEALSRIIQSSKLVLFLGSSLGNFERPEAIEFLRSLRGVLTESDRLLIGIDLRKDRTILEPAYDDAQGVTARFNLNLLTRINRELDGDFDLSTFRHRAKYNVVLGRIEMYLDSLCDQTINLRRCNLKVHFLEGEPIHTENSYKYSLDEIAALAAGSGFHMERQWIDSQNLFSVNLLAPLQ